MQLRNAIACAVTTLCLSIEGAHATDVTFVIDTPILSTLANFRDIAGISTLYGGTGYSNSVADDGVMRTGVFYRSSALSSLSAADAATLAELGITSIYDLRTTSEIAAAPDASVSGATDTNINILASTTVTATSSAYTSVTGADAYMTSMYDSFVTDASERSEFAQLLLALAHGDSAALIHCTSGKDRTGWAAVLLESIAGVSSSQIMTDYLATNSYSAATIEAYYEAALKYYTSLYGATVGEQMAEAIKEIYSVNSSWLTSALSEVIAEYGSMTNYLTEGLGLSMADIYVLRAKMVYYNSLPGQAAMHGNAAAGAALLQNLQNSSLSGNYTAFNYFLQSAIDAGTLDGMENRIGGQVHADALAYLMNQPLAVESAIREFGSLSAEGKPAHPVWVSVWSDITSASGATGSANSKSEDSGILIGTTHRVSPRLTVYGAIGSENQRVESAGATATLDSVQIAGGARLAIGALNSGTFVSGMLMASEGTYDSSRALGDNLGTATGGSHQWLYSATGMLGKSFKLRSLTVTPQIGLRYTQARINGFQETGSELALDMQAVKHDQLTARALVDLDINALELGKWTLTPGMTLGYEEALNSPTVTSTGSIEGYGISQIAAYDTRYLGVAALRLAASKGPTSAEIRVSGTAGHHGAASLAGSASLRYTF
jgi:protein-tyrosine phosphatase